MIMNFGRKNHGELLCFLFFHREKMKATEITNLIQRLKNAVHGLSKQNGDLQQQLTEVVLKKRTAEAHLASERNAQQKS